MMFTAPGDDFSRFTGDAHISLDGMEDTDAGELAEPYLIGEDLYPGEAEWFMEKHEYARLEGDAIVLYADADTVAVASEFFEAEARGDKSIIGHCAAEFPLIRGPSCDMVRCPADERPDDGSAEEEDEKHFHKGSIFHISTHCKLSAPKNPSLVRKPQKIYEDTPEPILARNWCGKFKKIGILQAKVATSVQ